MSPDDAKALLKEKGLTFDYPAFMDEDPQIPHALAELAELTGMPTHVTDIPAELPVLRQLYEAYAKENKTWHGQGDAYNKLYNHFTQLVAKMIADGAPTLDIVKTRLKLGSYLDGEHKAALYGRYPERESLLKLDFDMEQHFLNKKELHLLPKVWKDGWPWKGGRPTFEARFLHPEDLAAIDRLLEMKKSMESQLQMADRDPASTLDSMRDLHTKLQNRLDNAVDRAIANKKNRQNWYLQLRTLLTWVSAGVGAVVYAVERNAAMTASANNKNDNDKNKGK